MTWGSFLGELDLFLKSQKELCWTQTMKSFGKGDLLKETAIMDAMAHLFSVYGKMYSKRKPLKTVTYRNRDWKLLG